MSNSPSDHDAKTKANSALVLNKVKPIAIPESASNANKKNQPAQKQKTNG